MQIFITTRHFKADDIIKSYAADKVAKLEKFFSKIVSAKVLLIKERYRHIAEIVLSGRNMQLASKESSTDMHSALDLAIGKLAKQLTRFRDKTKEHKARKYEEKLKQERLDIYENQA